jgi:hypothetical protein
MVSCKVNFIKSLMVKFMLLSTETQNLYVFLFCGVLADCREICLLHRDVCIAIVCRVFEKAMRFILTMNEDNLE